MAALADWMTWQFWPLIVLVLAIISIVGLIALFRMHAFIALMLVAIGVGILAPPGAIPATKTAPNTWVASVELAVAEFGNVCGRVGIVIALASVIGVCVMESGAADKIVRRFLALFGERKAGLALVTGGFPLGLPIFFDTFFMLLLPLARALRLRTGKDYVLFILAICVAGGVTHSLVAPHPGPLAMAEILKIDLGWSILVGAIMAIPTVAIGWQVAKYLNRKVDVPLRETAGMSLEDLQAVADRPERELPCVALSLAPVLLPILLISAASFIAALARSARSNWAEALLFAGNRNVALFIGAGIAAWLAARYRKPGRAPLGHSLGQALETAGVIILITSAGGAFGAMLNHAEVGAAIRLALENKPVNLIFISWAIAALMKFSLGSATVSMLTTAGMMAGFANTAALGCHPMYLFMSIGFGALGISWMNDSGFWVIGKLSGFTERETLKTWTLTAFAMSFAGLLETLLLSKLLPFA